MFSDGEGGNAMEIERAVREDLEELRKLAQRRGQAMCYAQLELRREFSKLIVRLVTSEVVGSRTNVTELEWRRHP